MTRAIVVLEGGRPLGCSFEEILKYHGFGSPGGVAHAFKVMERAWPELSPGGAPGARDAFEFVTRAVTGERFVVDAALARPERGRTLERFVFRLAYRERTVTLTLREGYVTEEFIDLARMEHRSHEQETRLAVLKQDMADRMMAARAEHVYDSVVS